MSNVFEIKPGIFYTGVVDKDLEIFDINYSGKLCPRTALKR